MHLLQKNYIFVFVQHTMKDRCLKYKAHEAKDFVASLTHTHTTQSSTCSLHGPVDMSHSESHF